MINFGGEEIFYSYADSEIIVLPVPYDETSTWIRGADNGPDAILNASVNLEFYDIETSKETHLHGIHTVYPVDEKRSPDLMVDAVKQRCSTLLNDGKFIVILGGNHSVSIGAIHAYAEFIGNLTVLQLDAHPI